MTSRPAGRRAGGRRRPVRCHVCGSPTLPGLDLGHQPVGDRLLSEAGLNRPETSYPLRLHHCPGCGLTQLGYVVSPRIVLHNYPFLSGTTRTATEHLQHLARSLVETADLEPRSFAVDIGSNDGTLLKGYRPYGVRFLGVDPAAGPVRIAREEGIPTVHDFFTEEVAIAIRGEHGRADAISAAGVFGHVAALDSLMRGVDRLLQPSGVFLTENQYWLDMVQRVHYDNVFHEHLRYYSLKPLQRLYAAYGLDIFDIRRSEAYGGSITVYGCRRGAFPVSPRVGALLAEEEAARLFEEETWKRFALAAEERRRALSADVHARVSAGEKVIGIGAPAKASTVCNYCRLEPDLVAYITEVNPLRIGKFLPGVHIPIVEEAVMFEDAEPPDAAILFAWNYYDEIVPKLRARGFEGQLIRP